MYKHTGHRELLLFVHNKGCCDSAVLFSCRWKFAFFWYFLFERASENYGAF